MRVPLPQIALDFGRTIVTIEAAKQKEQQLSHNLSTDQDKGGYLHREDRQVHDQEPV